MIRIRESLGNYKRVIKIATKPSKEDFLSSARICAIGMIVIGIVGFLFYIISILFIG